MSIINLPVRYRSLELTSLFNIMVQHIQPFIDTEATRGCTITLNKVINRKGNNIYKFDFTYPITSSHRTYGELFYRVKIELNGQTQELRKLECVNWWQPDATLGIYYFPKNYGSLQGGLNYWKRLGEVNSFDNGVRYQIKKMKRETHENFISRSLQNKDKYLSYVKEQLQNRFGGIN